MPPQYDAPPQAETSRSVWFDWQWYAVLLLALVVRGVWGYAQLDSLEADPDAYRQLAVNVLRIHSYTLDDPAEPTAFRPPLYPLLLAVTSFSRQVQPSEVFLVHLALGVLTVALTFVWCQMMGLTRWRGVAGLVVAIDPLLLNQATLVMTETLATFLAILSLVALAILVRSAGEQPPPPSRDITIRAVNLAGAVVLAVYCRPTFLVWTALLPLILLLCLPLWKQRLTAVGAYGLTVVFLLSPWVVRNYLVFQAPVLGTTHGGYTLLWGNNAEYYQYLQNPTTPVWDSSEFHANFSRQHPYEGTSASELARDRAAKAEALETMQANPALAAYSSLVRLTMFWRAVPHALSENESGQRAALRYAVGAWYLVQFALVLVGLYGLGRDLRHPVWLAALALVLSFTAIHLFYWSNIRMRSPLVPVLAVLACAGVQALRRVPDLRRVRGGTRSGL